MKKAVKLLSLGVLLATMMVGCGRTGGDPSSQTPSTDVGPGSDDSSKTEKTLVSIEMENYPSPDPVKSVDDVDLSSVSIKLNYSDGTSASIPVTKDMITWSDVVNGVATATVTYEGLYTTFVVNI